jgi:glycosyltransferase involved in cell wall biosynthesis
LSRLLFLLPSTPEPPDSGARIRNQGLINLLGAEHEIDTLVPPETHRSPLRRARDLASSDLPDMAQRRWSRTFFDTVRCRIHEGRYTAVQAEGIEMARYLAAAPPAERVYDAHNAEFLVQWRLAGSAGPVHKQLYSRLQWRRLERFERHVVRASRLTVAVSEHDANQLRALAGADSQVRVVPNGLDTSRYVFSLPRADIAPNVLFIGKLDFRPNAEAVDWFIREVLPPLSDVRLFAVGAQPPRWLVEAGQHDDRIAVTGYVADERPYLARCAALVLPLRTGGGSRLKALIAMASGLPIVSTGFGMEGLDAEPGTHFLVAESPADWVACVRRVLGDPGLRARLAHNGRSLVEQRYDWSAIRAQVRDAYAWLSG